MYHILRIILIRRIITPQPTATGFNCIKYAFQLKHTYRNSYYTKRIDVNINEINKIGSVISMYAIVILEINKFL